MKPIRPIISLSSAEEHDAMRDLCGENRPRHRGSHGNYSDAVNQRIGAIRNSFEGGNLTVQEARAQIRALQQEIQVELRTGIPHAPTKVAINNNTLTRKRLAKPPDQEPHSKLIFTTTPSFALFATML